MHILKTTIALFVLGIFHCALCSKVFEWANDWGSSVVTREFAQVHDGDKTIIHYSTDDDALGKTAPAITLYDFKFRNTDFNKGIIAIRPLISSGNQVCFIAKLDTKWWGTRKTISKRHGTTISPQPTFDKFRLQASFPSSLDPLSVQSIADFCNVDLAHVFYMAGQIKSVSGYSRTLRLHGLGGRLIIGIQQTFVNTVFGN